MIETRMSRRALALLIGVALVSGCKVIPRGPGAPQSRTPGPVTDFRRTRRVIGSLFWFR